MPSIWQVLNVLLVLPHAIANTEKVVFRAPTVPSYLATDLLTLRPVNGSRVGRLQYELETPFSTETTQWFSVENLGFNWHYELRICWPAIVSTVITSLT